MLLHNADGNAVALIDERLVLFVRVLPLTMAALEEGEAALWKQVEKASINRPAGLWVVVSGDAGLSAQAMLDRQRASFARMNAETTRLFVASTSIGSSVQTLAIRAVSNAFSKKRPHMQLFSDTTSAARWMALVMGIPFETLVAEYEATRVECEQQIDRRAVSF